MLGRMQVKATERAAEAVTALRGLLAIRKAGISRGQIRFLLAAAQPRSKRASGRAPEIGSIKPRIL
jgi:hypothetical protein